MYSLFVCLSQQGKRNDADQVNARLRRVEEDEDRARALLKEMVRSPRELGPRCELGILYLRLGRKDQGLQLLTNILQEDPKHAATHVALANFYAEKGDSLRAQRHRRAAAGADGLMISRGTSSKE
jgi:predicted Zn-dependent protease